MPYTLDSLTFCDFQLKFDCRLKIMGDYVTLHLQVRVKMNRMSLRIAQRLKVAQNTYAMLTAFNEIDMRFVVLLEIESTE